MWNGQIRNPNLEIRRVATGATSGTNGFRHETVKSGQNEAKAVDRGRASAYAAMRSVSTLAVISYS